MQQPFVKSALQSQNDQREEKQRARGNVGRAKIVEGSELRQRLDRIDRETQIHRNADLADREQKYEYGGERDCRNHERQRYSKQNTWPPADQPSRILEPGIHSS